MDEAGTSYPSDSSDWDPSFLVGQTLELVSIAEYTSYLNFDEGVTVTIHGAFQADDVAANGRGEWSLVPANSDRLVPFVGRQVAEARLLVDTVIALEVKFSDGTRIQVGRVGPEQVTGYDNWSLQHGDDEWFFTE